MISKEKLEENFKKFCDENGLQNEWITLEEYYIDDYFFEKNEHVWDEISYLDGDRNPDWEENQENLEIDFDGWFNHDYPECPDSFPITEELYDDLNINGYIIDNNEKYWYNDNVNSEEYGNFIYENKTYADLPANLKEMVDSWWDDIVTVEYIEDNAWIADGLNISYFGEESYSKSAFIEAMAYWTIYFEPNKADWDAAWDSELYPFKYCGTFMLALGGCGMDLSAKLDCYQALVSKTLPNNSEIFRQPSYFDYVSPVKHEEILNMCKREHIKIKFEAEIEE